MDIHKALCKATVTHFRIAYNISYIIHILYLVVYYSTRARDQEEGGGAGPTSQPMKKSDASAGLGEI